MKIKEDREHWLRRVMVILFAFHFSLLTSSAQDDKSTMFNPVEHAVISQTIAPAPNIRSVSVVRVSP